MKKMKDDTLCATVVALCIIINGYIAVCRHWPIRSERGEIHSWIGDDYPEHLSLDQPMRPKAMTFQNFTDFPISGPGSTEKWDSIHPPGFGFVRMGSDSRLLCTTMFHELHCIEKMRLVLDDPFNRQISLPHQEHCMNYLRQLFLCKADMTLEPIATGHLDVIGPDVDSSMMSGDGVVHTCGDWEVLYRYVGRNYLEWKATWNVSA
ncbi:Oxidase ustYa [Hypsizygus marmoreus]|uniref:Oxidase ustYa n=1 Tax=Hypsizygus marmoreus TaxID=39966 RepID=A0A369JLC4_HYPMA|nr:Oxidase ustYa [Hypsizygus marmoreus]